MGQRCRLIFPAVILILAALLVAGVIQVSAQNLLPYRIIEVGGKTFIIDRTGERWDITQARGLGFEPHNFQYGIGRHTIKPLSDALLTTQTRAVPPNLKVIGVAADSQAQAYSVARLTRHEIVNGQVGAIPIAAAY
jgi:hypothetical protein